LRDRTTSPDGDSVTRLNVGIQSAEISGEENIGKENYFVIGNTFGNF
jgi:hypothetical protein